MGVDLNELVKGPMFVRFKFAMKVCFNYFLYALLWCNVFPRSFESSRSVISVISLIGTSVISLIGTVFW